jgi:hypothetical protein
MRILPASHIRLIRALPGRVRDCANWLAPPTSPSEYGVWGATIAFVRRVAIVLCSAAVAAAVVSGACSGGASAASSTKIAAPTARSAIRLAECRHCFTSVRHASAKLLTLGDLEAAFPGVTVPSWTTNSEQQFWAVAVSGVVNPGDLFSATVQHDTWAVFVLSRQTGLSVAAYFGSQGRWPPWFHALPNLPLST